MNRKYASFQDSIIFLVFNTPPAQQAAVELHRLACVCVLYLDLLQQHGRVGEVADIVRSLHHLRDRAGPLGAVQQGVLEDAPQL